MAERVIWERTIDHDKIQARHDRFRRLFFAPAAAVVLAAAIFVGWQNAIGVAIVVGAIGLGWRTTVRFKGLSEAANPVMVVDRGRLKLGEREITMNDVKRFTTLATSMQTSLLGKYSRVHIGKALFRLDEPGSKGGPDIVEFGWPSMREEGVATIREALEAELPGKWVAPTELVAEDELPARSNRHRIGLGSRANSRGRDGLS